MTRHQVAPITRRKVPNTAKLPTPAPRVAPVTFTDYAASTNALPDYAGVAAELTNDEITER